MSQLDMDKSIFSLRETEGVKIRDGKETYFLLYTLLDFCFSKYMHVETSKQHFRKHTSIQLKK